MKVQVAYGRIDPAAFDRCPRCKGSGQEMGRACPYCTGTGVHAGRAFTYSSHLALQVGDVVLVPATWRDELRGDRAAKEATIVRIGSDYDGETSAILRLVEAASACAGADK